MTAREKLAAEGIEALSDGELVSILLRTGASRIPVIQLAESLLISFGGLRGLLGAQRETLELQHGLGPVKTAQLLAVMELSKRYLEETLKRGDPLESPQATET